MEGPAKKSLDRQMAAEAVFEKARTEVLQLSRPQSDLRMAPPKKI